MPVFNIPMIVRAILIWLLLMAAESAQGALRRFLTDPDVEFAARQVSVVVGVMIMFAVTGLLFPIMRIRTDRGALAVGLLWACLTFLFEIGLGRATGASWSRLWSDYDLAHGGLMGLGLVAMALIPWIVFRLRGGVEGVSR